MSDDNGSVFQEMLPETRLLADTLKATPIGHTATYEELSRVSGRDIRPGESGYHLLRSARRIAERELASEGRPGLFGTESAIGVKRLEPSEQPGHLDSARHKIRRKAARELKRSTYADYAAMTPEEQMRLNLTRTVFAITKSVNGRKALKNIEAGIREHGKSLDFKKAIQCFQTKTIK